MKGEKDEVKVEELVEQIRKTVKQFSLLADYLETANRLNKIIDEMDDLEEDDKEVSFS